jgi:hypothetical protein
MPRYNFITGTDALTWIIILVCFGAALASLP